VLDNKNEQGFTLIELMIALAVFTIGIVAALSLALANYNNSRDNLDKIVASNLAREGIELIRNVRDSNWLRAEANASCEGNPCAWDYGLDVTSNYVYIDYNDPRPSLASSGNCALGHSQCMNNCGTDGAFCRLYKNNTSNFYDHDDSGVPSKYYRVIKLEEICLNEDIPDPPNDEYYDEYTQDISNDCLNDDVRIGIKVTAYVEWQDNTTKSVEIVDKLYNWRR
jgi:prepilin-type N-terminal cleavage/methylation domain-containing protein